MDRLSVGYHTIYVRNWRVLGAIWVLFALSSTVLQILVLVHPAWIGSDDGGYFGLYDYCANDECPWNVFKLQIRPLSLSSQLAATLVLIATACSLIAVLAILLLVLLRDRYVFLLCSWMHLFSFCTMLSGCLLFPNGWDHPRVREICDSRQYELGLCRIRWPYLLAFVLVIDQLCLSMLGFVLACKQPPSLPEVDAYAPSQITTMPIGGFGMRIQPTRRNSVQESFYSKSSSRLQL